MHDINFIRENPKEFDKELLRRGIETRSKEILELDEIIKKFRQELQELQQQKNLHAKQIGNIKAKGGDIRYLLVEADKIKHRIAELEGVSEEEKKLHDILSNIPNILDEDVHHGESEAENLEVRKWGEPKELGFKPQEHFQIGEKLELMDFVQTAKISGSRFVTLFGDLARLERALINFMIDVLSREYGFQEVSAPFLVNPTSLYGTGQLPKFATESFETTDGKWLIPTAEVPLANLVREQILQVDKLPLRYCAYTPCFRSEAGAAGKDTKGMFRVHQFSKVEMVVISDAENSHHEHDRITKIAEKILEKLEIPYRTVLLCSGDTGFSATKTYDIEVWLPGQKKYREISSCSNCSDFQARRMKARYRDSDGQVKFLHTLNGSGLAIGRTMIAIIENYQNEDGSITVPGVLIPYMGGVNLIRAE